MDDVRSAISADVAAMRGRAPDTADDFRGWVEPHWPVMAALTRRMCPGPDWEDALQESLAAAWRKRSRYDPSRGTVRTWLLAIAADRARKSRRVTGLLAERGRTLRPEPADDGAAGLTASDIDLDRAVAALPHRQRLAVTLHYVIGLPVAETARVMGCSDGTVKSTLYDARAGLRARLGEDYR